jgi:2-oxopent-4-enoate hydratase
MQVNRSELSLLAETLAQARKSRQPCAPLTETQPALTIRDAYAISEITLKERLVQGGAKLVGKKIGLTSRAVQKQLGVAEPDFGYLSSDMNIPMGETVSLSALLQPRVEGEVAFVLKKRLEGTGLTVADVIAATDFVLPSIEIIDSRVKDWKIKIQDTVADNASSALYVLGTEPRKLGRVDLRLAGMALRVNGEVLSTGCGAACLDHPALAVAWLGNALGRFGVALEPGELILSGAFGPVVPVNAGDRVDVEIAGLGSVHCFFGE